MISNQRKEIALPIAIIERDKKATIWEIHDVQRNLEEAIKDGER